MLIEFAVIAFGLIVSFFLKDINFLSVNYIYPDFLMIFLIYFALRRGEFSGIWIGFFAGLLEDSGILTLSGGEYVHILGMHMFFYTLVGYILGKMNKIVDRELTFPVITIVFIVTFIVRLFIWLLTWIMIGYDKNYSFLGTSVFTALISPIWFWLLGWIYKYTSEAD